MSDIVSDADATCPRCDKPVYRGDWSVRCRCTGAVLRAEIETLRQEVRKLQQWIHAAVNSGDPEADCGWLCKKVCAGPCEGLPVGPRGHLASQEPRP